MTDLRRELEAMVRRQIEARGIHDPAVLDALRAVPREEFVGRRASAGWPMATTRCRSKPGRRSRQPYIVALMIEAAEVKAGDKVLEVGAGSGYAAAVIEPHRRRGDRDRAPAANLGALARERMARLGYANVAIVEGDGTRGWPDEAPVRRHPRRGQRQPCRRSR